MRSAPVVYAVFFASGFSALVYQVVWVEMLDTIFGVTTFAASAVLGAYFGGLALGGYLGGKLVARHGGLQLYGIIEIALGLAAAVVPTLLEYVTDAYRMLYPSMADREVLVTSVRFLLSCIVLLVPAMLIGMALPVLVQTLTRDYDDIGRKLPRLYGWNTFGSVLGALLTGYVLVGFLGLRRTNDIAVAINLAAGAVALLVSRSMPGGRTGSESERSEASPPDAAVDSAWRKTALAVTFCSGFTALGYEVVWFRVLGLMSDHRAHTFSAIVAVVLLGIAVGSLAVGRLNRRPFEPSSALAVILLGFGAVGFLWLPLVTGLSSALAAAGAAFVQAPARSSGPFAVAIAVTFLPCVLMGMSFPLAVQVYARHSRQIGDGVGLMYALNLIGAMFGSIVAGFVLLPVLGAQLSLYSLSSICLLAAAILHYGGGRVGHMRAMAGVVALAAAVIVFSPGDLFDALFLHVYPHARILETHEDIEATVTLAQHGSSQVMYVNGAHQADDSPWTIGVHRLIGLVPCLVHGDVRHALVIGMGGGTTAGEVARCSDDTTIVEISPSVVQVARAFGGHNRNVADSPKARTIIADGRNFLLVSDHRFDLITADSIRPVHAQSGNLYSRDYYLLMTSRLKKNGVVFQWIDVSLRDHEERILMRTFASAFPHLAMCELGGNKFLLGANEPLLIDATSIRARLTPAVLDDLAAAGVANAETFLSAFALTGDDLRAAIGTGPIITDDRPINEYFSLWRIGELWRYLPVETAVYRPRS